MNNSSTFRLECDRDESNLILASSDCVYAELDSVPNWLPQSDTIDSSILTRFVQGRGV